MSRWTNVRRETGPLGTPAVIAPGMTAGTGGVWAWALIPTRSTDELSANSLAALTSTTASELRQALPRDVPFHIKVQWGRYDGEAHIEQQLAHWGATVPPGAQQHVQLQGRRIDALAFPRRQVLLGIRLDEIKGAQSRATQAGSSLLGAPNAIRDARHGIERYSERAQAWLDRMRNTSFRARPATTSELAWSMRRDLRRTVDWLPQGRLAGEGETARLRAGQVIPHSDHLVIRTDAGDRYLQCLTASTTGFPADDLALPGGEWLRDLLFQDSDDMQHTYPVEVSVRGRNVSPHEAARRMSEAMSLLKEQGREASRGLAEEAPDEMELARETLRTRMSEVARGQASMVEDTPVWIVEADSLDGLRRRSQFVIDHYASMQINLWSGENLQGELWRSSVIGDHNRINDFMQFRPLTTLVGGWFHGGSALGQDDAPYVAANIGSTPSPFRIRITDAALDGDPVTSVFVGRSGSGKSTAVMLICLAEAIYGSWVLLVDLKGDLVGLPAAARSFGVPTTEVSNAHAASGSMCPFRYMSDPQQAAQQCLDTLQLMLRKSIAGSSEGILRRVTNEISILPDPEDRSTAAVIELLQHSDDATERSIGDELAELAKDPLARPLAGRPDPTAPGLPTGRGLVYMRLSGMVWPEESAFREDWSPANRLTMMMVKAVFAYSTYMSSRVRGIPKVVALPELHLITPYDVGRSTVSSTALMGRALDTSLLLDTQAGAHLEQIKGLEDQITMVCAFAVNSDSEAAVQARMLGLEPDRGVLDRQKTWGKGECECRDRWGQLAPIQWDYMSAELKELLSTTQKRDALSVEQEDVA